MILRCFRYDCKSGPTQQTHSQAQKTNEPNEHMISRIFLFSSIRSGISSCDRHRRCYCHFEYNRLGSMFNEMHLNAIVPVEIFA